MPLKNNSIKWYRTPLEKRTLKKISKKNNQVGLFYITLHILLLLFTGLFTYLLFKNNYFFLATISLFIHSTFYSFLGWAGAGHELSHNTVFKSQKLNTFFLQLFSFLTWNNYIFFRSSHAYHHKMTVYDAFDYEVRLDQKFNSKHWIFSSFFDFLAFYRTIKITIENSLGIIHGEWGNKLFPKKKIRQRKSLFNWARVMLFGHIFFASIFIYFGEYSLLFIITFAPFISTLLNKLLSKAQHLGMQGNIPDFRKNSRTIILNPFLAFLYWQMNYHIEHHMYPAVPFFNLKTLHSKIKYDLPLPTDGILDLLKKMQAIKNSITD